METRIWSKDDRRRSKEFLEVIERRLKIRIIFRSLESFVGGSENKRIVATEMELVLEQTQQGTSYEVSNIRVIPKYQGEDGNPARANIKQALGSYKDGDGDGDTQFQQSQSS
ncbi:hypothetical protein Tco_1215212 [Tanacetum coccineum]